MKKSAVTGALAVAALLSLSGTLAAQTTALEVASVRLADPGNMKGVQGGCHGIDSKSGGENADVPLGRCAISDGRLSHMIAIAWQLKTISQIQNAPEWVISTDERYNLQAKAEDPKATEAQLLGMLQQVLVDRFQLKYHRDEHEEHGYALVVAKGGPKMEPSKEGEVMSMGPFNKNNPTVTIAPHRVSMAMLAQFLSTFGPGGQVTDETGLDGFYNFELSWNEKEGPSVFSAIQKIGLRLESRKVSVSYFVIDSAERPSAN